MPGRAKTKLKKKQALSTAQALRQLRKLRGIFSKRDIPDPVAWQRKIRRDRSPL